MERLLYVSESCIGEFKTTETISEIVASACIKNAALAVTGALLFTGTHFAQILEGPTSSIAPLIASIINDPRHTKLVIVDRFVIKRRRFAEWQMTYHGPSQFVSRHVSRLLDSPSQSEQRRASEWLIVLAQEFSKKHSG